jgi:serine/threonine protein phosphatase PrpC
MKSFALTDKGKARSSNQDYVFCADNPIGNLPNLYIVADGMGGHKAGDLASKCAVNEVVKHIKKCTLKEPISILKESIDIANNMILKKSIKNPEYEGMGTTLVAATILDKTMYVANIGDSRLYLVNDKLQQVTKDHSLVEEMVDMGELDKNSARVHVNKNIITKALGVDEELEADYFKVKISDKDIVLLCSDGLTNMVEDTEIYDIVHKGDAPDDMALKLIEAANQNGGKDNISVVIAMQNPS